MTGILVVDKPVGPTSFEIVRRLRMALPHRCKVGHGGTLDPAASGVLPVCVGEATKVAAFLLNADKEYRAEVRFGVETDSQDAEGEVIAERSTAGLTRAGIDAALDRFRGAIDQVPPMVSAKKHTGRRLYEHARAGRDVPRSPARVVIHRLELLDFSPPDRATLAVRCSKGTYVRALAADLGHALGTGAHLSALRRTRSGPFSIETALSPQDVERRLRTGAPLPWLAPAAALAHLPAVTLDEAAALALRQGRRAPAGDVAAGEGGLVRALGPDGALVAVARREADGWLRSRRGFAAAGPDSPTASQAAVDGGRFL